MADSRDNAIKYYQMALRLRPPKTHIDELSTIRRNLAWVYYLSGDFYEAAIVGEFLASLALLAGLRVRQCVLLGLRPVVLVRRVPDDGNVILHQEFRAQLGRVTLAVALPVLPEVLKCAPRLGVAVQAGRHGVDQIVQQTLLIRLRMVLAALLFLLGLLLNAGVFTVHERVLRGLRATRSVVLEHTIVAGNGEGEDQRIGLENTQDFDEVGVATATDPILDHGVELGIGEPVGTPTVPFQAFLDAGKAGLIVISVFFLSHL